jgi:hypothetical protein
VIETTQEKSKKRKKARKDNDSTGKKKGVLKALNTKMRSTQKIRQTQTENTFHFPLDLLDLAKEYKESPANICDSRDEAGRR